MRRTTRLSTKRTKKLSSSDEEDNKTIKVTENKSDKYPPEKKLKNNVSKQNENKNDNSSSSESDIEDYLQPVHKLDLNSSFFDIQKKDDENFKDIENKIYNGITRLSDTDSDENDNESKSNNEKEADSIAEKMTFEELKNFHNKLEEARKHVEQYKKKNKNKQIDTNNDTKKETQEEITNLLASLENKHTEKQHESDNFDSHSDNEEWEEVNIKNDQEQILKNKEDIQIILEMPDGIKKKKGVDLMAAVKRRLNRIRKENQILIHKVHLLCWIAHGNYVNSILNSEKILALCLSLLPSEKSYPSNRVDIQYVEQIVGWFRKTVKNVGQSVPDNLNLSKLLHLQISKKEAYNKKMLTYIFISLMRSLGIHCRLILSFQVEPLRPRSSDLLSLSEKTEKDKQKSTKQKVKNTVVKPSKKSKKTLKKSNDIKKLEIEKSPKITRSKENITKVDVKKNSEKKSNQKSKSKIIEGESKTRDKKITKESDKKKSTKQQNSNYSKKTSELSNKNIKTSDEKLESSQTSDQSRRNLRSQKHKTSDIKDRKKSAKISNKNTPSKSKDSRTTRTKATSKKSDTISSKEKKVVNVEVIIEKVQDQKSLFESRNTRNSKANNSELNENKNLKKRNLSEREKLTKPNFKKLKLKQLDGVNDDTSDEDEYNPDEDDKSEEDYDSSDDFQPSTSSNNRYNKPNLRRLSTISPTKKQTIDVRDDIINLVTGRIKEEEQKEEHFYVFKSRRKTYKNDEYNFDPKIRVKKRIAVKPSNNRKLLSTDDEYESEKGEIVDKKEKKKVGNDVWLEVFSEVEEKWISVDISAGQIHCVNELYSRASHPMSYVVAWNNDKYLKDVTKRYCQNYNTTTRKLRIDFKWWDETLKPFLGPKTPRCREEDDEFERQQLEKPLPTSIAEYKNHPLYALKRHLLKFEGIYPSDAPPLGFVRSEPVYSRQCVYTLCSRDIWLKQAKVVKVGEQPYKHVKARPKYDKLSNSLVNGQMLELFGPWQTEDYVPPTAENGIVPRNAYGNVELFKRCMLPKKTVHLQLPGLNKIARRMNIDCATAIVGFDFHGGWSHPTYDGFVVCEEYADQLIAAWELEQEEIARKENEKIEKRVYGNWRKLIKGLLIRERLKVKYNFGETSSQNKKKTNENKSKTLKKNIITSDSDSETE